MIHPLPLPECAFYQNTASAIDIAVGLDGNSCSVHRGHTHLELVAADPASPQSNPLQRSEAIAATAAQQSESSGDVAAFPSVPSSAQGGIRRWFTIAAAIYGICSALSAVFLVLVLKHDARTFNTNY